MEDLAATVPHGTGSHGIGHTTRGTAGRERKGNRVRATLFALTAATLLGIAPSALAAGANCLFQAKGLALSFGPLDPSNATTVTIPITAATVNANRVGDCPSNRTMVISGDNGLNFSSSRRMRKGATSDFIPYSLSLPTAGQAGPGNGNYVNFTFSGTVVGTDYQNASAGAYSDTVIITVSP